MKRNTSVVAGLTAALLGSTIVVACGGRTIENEWTGGASGLGGTGGNTVAGGSGGSDGSKGGSGGLTGGSGGSTGGEGGTGGSTGGEGGAGGSTGGTGGSGGSTGGKGGTGGSTGGKGGTGGSTGGKGGAPGADAGVRVVCGMSVCGPITSVAGTWPPCCLVDEPNACGGFVLGTVCLSSTPGTADASCPSVSVMGQALPGCCRRSGLCGANMSIVGLGCNDPAILGGAPAGKCKPPPLN
jgi:hypothetical protein